MWCRVDCRFVVNPVTLFQKTRVGFAFYQLPLLGLKSFHSLTVFFFLDQFHLIGLFLLSFFFDTFLFLFSVFDSLFLFLCKLLFQLLLYFMRYISSDVSTFAFGDFDFPIRLTWHDPGSLGWMDQAYSRLSTTHGHITDCKLLVCMYWTRLVLVRPAASLFTASPLKQHPTGKQ